MFFGGRHWDAEPAEGLGVHGGLRVAGWGEGLPETCRRRGREHAGLWRVPQSEEPPCKGPEAVWNGHLGL